MFWLWKRILWKTPYQRHPYLIEQSVNVSSKDKVWKTFATRMKSISLPKSLRVCSTDKTNVSTLG